MTGQVDKPKVPRKPRKKKLKPGRKPLPKKKGPPSGYNERMAETILELARKGNSEVEIAAKVGISETTLHNWKGKHPDFYEALKKSRNFAIDMVEGALFQNAMGYSHPAVKHFHDAKRGEVVTEDYIERYKPDTTAQIFFLKNRAPDRWKDVNKHEHAGAGGGAIQVAVEERRRLFVEVVAEPRTADLAEQLAMQLAQRRLAQTVDTTASESAENKETEG